MLLKNDQLRFPCDAYVALLAARACPDSLLVRAAGSAVEPTDLAAIWTRGAVTKILPVATPDLRTVGDAIVRPKSLLALPASEVEVRAALRAPMARRFHHQGELAVWACRPREGELDLWLTSFGLPCQAVAAAGELHEERSLRSSGVGEWTVLPLDRTDSLVMQANHSADLAARQAEVFPGPPELLT